MNTTLVHRRHVERFAQLLDEAEGARRHHSRSALDDELAELLDTGNRLAEIKPPVVMDEPRRAEVRAHLMRVAEEQGIGVTAKRAKESAVGRARVGTVVNPTTKRQPFARRVRARGAILVGLAVGAVAISGIAAASGGAMPGDVLYGLKRSQEQATLALHTDPVSRGQIYLGFAGTRLNEAENSNRGTAQFASLMADMDADTQSGAALLLGDALTKRDVNSVDTVNAFYDAQLSRIDGLLDQFTMTDPRRPRLLFSEHVLNLVHQRAADISAVLGCPGRFTVAAPDRFGPTVTPCGSAPTTHGG